MLVSVLLTCCSTVFALHSDLRFHMSLTEHDMFPWNFLSVWYSFISFFITSERRKRFYFPSSVLADQQAFWIFPSFFSPLSNLKPNKFVLHCRILVWMLDKHSAGTTGKKLNLKISHFAINAMV